MQFRFIAIAALVASLATPSVASAQLPPDVDNGRNSFLLPHFRLGAEVDVGRGMYTDPGTDFSPTLVGYHYSERTGIISGLIWGGWTLLIGGFTTAAVAAPTNTKSTTSTSTSYSRDGRYKTTRTTTTTTGTVTAEQGERAQKTLDATQEAAGDAVLSVGNGMDVTIYDDEIAGTDKGQGWGYRVAFWMPIVRGTNAQFDLGWQVGDVISVNPDRNEAVRSYSFAFPLRLIFAFSYFATSLTWDLNFASFFNHDDGQEEVDGVSMYMYETRPWPLTLDLHAMWWRFHIYGAIMTSRPLDLDFGYRAGVGFKF